jgi:hypothetical protein
LTSSEIATLACYKPATAGIGGPQLAFATRAIHHGAKAAFAKVAAQFWAASLLNIKHCTLLEPLFLIDV